MTGDPYTPEEARDLRELVEAARRMADGEFQRLVKIEARGQLGHLARYINQTMGNLQQLDPTVRTSSHEFPRMSEHLSDVVRTTEQASMQVMDEVEAIVGEQAAMEGLIRQLATLLKADDRHETAVQTLARLQELNSGAQERALKIMGAMEFQDITAQRIEKSLALIAEIQDRLLRLLVLFNVPPDQEGGGNAETKWKMLSEFAAASDSNTMDQGMVDRLLAELGQNGQ